MFLLFLLLMKRGRSNYFLFSYGFKGLNTPLQIIPLLGV